MSGGLRPLTSRMHAHARPAGDIEHGVSVGAVRASGAAFWMISVIGIVVRARGPRTIAAGYRIISSRVSANYLTRTSVQGQGARS